MSKFSLLILSAGFGKRMLDLTKQIPKPMLKFKNKTLIGNTINFFRQVGFNEIFINTHYLYDKIESYINTNYKNEPISIIYEPRILGTGGAVKNIFNYTKNKNICVVNSDIFWKEDNKSDIVNFLKDFNDNTYCKILLSKKSNFYGLQTNKGDFSIKGKIISNWTDGNEVIYYSGFQIVNIDIFHNIRGIFSMNKIWNNLILNNKLKGELIQSNILHIGDKNTFHKL